MHPWPSRNNVHSDPIHFPARPWPNRSNDHTLCASVLEVSWKHLRRKTSDLQVYSDCSLDATCRSLLTSLGVDWRFASKFTHAAELVCASITHAPRMTADPATAMLLLVAAEVSGANLNLLLVGSGGPLRIATFVKPKARPYITPDDIPRRVSRKSTQPLQPPT